MEKEFKIKILKIAFPIILQSFLTAVINLADVFMIGRIGAIEIASVGLANQILFLFVLFCLGINNSGGIFVAQYFGRGDHKNIKTIHAIVIVLSLLLALTFAALAFFIPDKLMMLYTKDTRVIDVVKPYLKIVSISYIFTGLTLVYSTLLKSMGNTYMAMYASVTTLLVNIVLNYLLIFGNLGFPELGVMGAAIATSLARLFELITIIVVSKIKSYDIFLKTEYFKEITVDKIKKFFKTGLPVIGSHVTWSLATTVLFMVYARVGTEAITVMNISGSIERIAFIVIVGFGSAVSVIVGQELGQENFDKAYKISKYMLKLNVVSATIIGGVLFIISHFLVDFYNIPTDIKLASERVLKILSLVLPIRAFNFTNMVGILRAGGDTKTIFLIDVASTWGTAIPMAFLGYKLGLPIFFVFAMACSEELIKIIAITQRFISKKWLKSV